MAARCEYQVRADWEFNPGVYSLHFASEVNTGVSLSIKRGLSKDDNTFKSGKDVQETTSRIYKLLYEGEYLEPGTNARRPVNGDLSKISQVIGISDKEKALLRNVYFMSNRLPGTRQMRNCIRHLVFSSRVFYGNPTFMTITPSERHSWLAIRLSRGRREDPAYKGVARSQSPWCGYDSPSLIPPPDSSEDEALIDLPDYDTRKTITSRDPLCCVYAFQVMTDVISQRCSAFESAPTARGAPSRTIHAWMHMEAMPRLWAALPAAQMR